MRPFRIALSLFVASFATANDASATSFTYSSYSVTNPEPISISSPNAAIGDAG